MSMALMPPLVRLSLHNLRRPSFPPQLPRCPFLAHSSCRHGVAGPSPSFWSESSPIQGEHRLSRRLCTTSSRRDLLAVPPLLRHFSRLPPHQIAPTIRSHPVQPTPPSNLPPPPITPCQLPPLNNTLTLSSPIDLHPPPPPLASRPLRSVPTDRCRYYRVDAARPATLTRIPHPPLPPPTPPDPGFCAASLKSHLTSTSSLDILNPLQVPPYTPNSLPPSQTTALALVP